MELDTTKILSIYNEPLYVNKIHNQLPELQGNYTKPILLFKNALDNNADCDTLLQKMLQACGVSLDECYSCIISDKAHTIPLINIHQPNIILSFGIYIENELFRLYPHINSVQKIYDGNAIITMPLHKLLHDAAGKNALWIGLQKMFGIEKK